MKYYRLLFLLILAGMMLFGVSCYGVASGKHRISYSISDMPPAQSRIPLNIAVLDFKDTRRRIVNYSGDFGVGPKGTIREPDFGDPIPNQIKKLFVRDLNNISLFKDVFDSPGECPTSQSQIIQYGIEKNVDLMLCTELFDFWEQSTAHPIYYPLYFAGLPILAFNLLPILGPNEFWKGQTEISYKIFQTNNAENIWTYTAKGKKKDVAVGFYYNFNAGPNEIYSKVLYPSLQIAQKDVLGQILQFFSEKKPEQISAMKIEKRVATATSFSTRNLIAVAEITPRQGVEVATIPMITDSVRDALVRSGRYTVLDRNNMEVILKEMKFQQGGCTDSSCVVEMGRILGVTKMITGSIGRVGKTLVLTLMQIDVATGKIDKSTMYKCESCAEEDIIFKLDEAIKPLLQ